MGAERAGSALKGVYVLFLRVPFSLSIPIGALGTVQFKGGHYAYVGSALGGVRQRVSRHMRKEKTLHWHVDYLLLRSRVVDLVVAPTEKPKECAIARRLAERFEFVRGFGCSDCRCESHLFYHPELHVLVREVLRAMRAEKLRPVKGLA